MNGLVLGIDLGTSYFKLGLFDREGMLCGLRRLPVEKDEGEGWCELPVEHFWEALRTGLAQAVPAGCDGLVALPSAKTYPGLEGFTGRSEHHGHGHFFRAIMESVSNSLLELVKQLFDEQMPEKRVAVGGGAKSDLWLQIDADMLGSTFATTSSPDTACQGAAMLATKEAGWLNRA